MTTYPSVLPRAAARPRWHRAHQGSERIMGSVAERLAARRLAAAEPDFFGLPGGKSHRGQPGVLVRAVAERLIAAAAASAPEVPLAFFDGDVVGRFRPQRQSAVLRRL